MNPDEAINSLSNLASLFRTVGESARLRLLHLLCMEELSVGEIVRIVNLPQSTVSRHLKALREQGLVADRPSGPVTYYRAVLEAEIGQTDTAVRDALLTAMRSSPLPESDKEGLDRVLTSRGVMGDAFFDRIGARWDQMREECFGPSFHLEAFLQLLPHEWTVADLGTGTGYMLPALGRHFQRVVAIDNSQAMLDVARKRVADASLDNVDLRLGDLETIPMADGEAHLAVAILMLHHLADVSAALREVARILKPGGQLLIVEFYPHRNETFRVAMADRRPGIAPDQMAHWLAEAGLRPSAECALEYRDHPELEIAPIPRLYALRAWAVASTNPVTSISQTSVKDVQ